MHDSAVRETIQKTRPARQARRTLAWGLAGHVPVCDPPVGETIHKARPAPRARRALAWALGGYVVVQLAFSGLRHDPEYAHRLDLLTARRAEDPHRPLLLVVGSSRTLMGFCPEMLPPLRTPSGQQILPFNFSCRSAGPLMNLMEVERLLHEGIRPDWLVLEIMPAFLGGEGFDALTAGVGALDIPLLQHYVSPWRLYGQYVLHRLVTRHGHQLEFLRRHGFAWILGETYGSGSLRPLGGPYLEDRLDRKEQERRTGLMRGQYFPALQELTISPAGDQATRALLELCRREHIRPVLLLSPESSAFRSWYSPEALAAVSRYLDTIARHYDVPVIDARTWVADKDFQDGHHVLAPGAAVFTRRLARELLQPLVEGRLDAPAAVAAGHQGANQE